MNKDNNNSGFQTYEDLYSDSRGIPSNKKESYRRSRNNITDMNTYKERGNYNKNVSSAHERYERERNDRSSFYDVDNNGEYVRRSFDTHRVSNHHGRKRMKRSVRRALIVTVSLLIVFVLILGIVGVTRVLTSVGDVGEIKISDVTDSSLVLSWQKAANAKGYHVFYRESSSQEDTEYETVNDPDTLSLTVSDLGQAKEYVFTVSAFNDKNEGKKKITSENTFTLPETVQISQLSSTKPGVIHVEWKSNSECDGYVVEYHRSDADEYSTYQVDDHSTSSADIPDLDVNKTYGVRVYAFLNRNNEKVNGTPGDEKTVEVTETEVEQTPVAQTPELDSGIDPDKPMIAFSFDDGPTDAGASDRILDVLEENNAKATFFMVGWNASQVTDNVKRKAELKMELGNHTWDHTHYSESVTKDDISRCSETIYELTGQYPTAFRSPGGMTTDVILTECAAENMPVYRWSIDTRDWETRDANKIYKEVMNNVKDGDIVLMHEIYDATADAVEKMVPELIKKGYQIVTCHDLILAKTGEEPKAGTEYFSASETN